MIDSKFQAIKEASLEYSKEEYATAYPALTDAQIKILIEGEADEPSRESVQSTTGTNKQRSSKWRGFR
ncbi:MAG: hypothetical protein HN470_05730 [Nitrosomonadales bacterium]|jgi:hypothetical protein|nr:hypothetical protein [Nitrosomonadales bacterium]